MAFGAHGFHGSFQEAVRMGRGFADLAPTHAGELLDLLAELGTVGVERHQLSDEGIGSRRELGLLSIVERYESRGLGLGNYRNRLRGREYQVIVASHRSPLEYRLLA